MDLADVPDRPPVDDRVAALADAADAYADAREAVADVGEDRVQTVADAHDTLVGLLDRYEDDATGTGDFGSYVEFRGQFAATVEELPEDLPRRAAFETARDAIDKQLIGADDFERAREELGPAGDLAARLDDREATREAYETARRRVREARETAAERASALERIRRLGEADLDAPVEALRDPVREYDDRVSDAFAEYRRSVSTRRLLAFVEAAEAYPLVDVTSPPDQLVEYVRGAEAGREDVATLLEYADYSRSKLDHYVEDPGALKRAVGSNQTYLQRLDETPLTVGWPPPAAGVLRRRARELRPLVARVADEQTVALLREVRELTRETRYGRLRDAAVARAELDEEAVRALREGEVSPELERAREDVSRLEESLDEHAV